MEIKAGIIEDAELDVRLVIGRDVPIMCPKSMSITWKIQITIFLVLLDPEHAGDGCG